jgi:pSer/pThr/pTyr-binding forkhead associated (FHA) protein
MQNESNSSKIFLGRGNDAQVRISDISVSRLHAFIVRGSDSYYYLFDNESKFGTLAAIKKPLRILAGHTVKVQVS